MTGPQSLLLECVCWDKDRFGKVRPHSRLRIRPRPRLISCQDYLGEFDVALDDVFVDGKVAQEVGHGPPVSAEKSGRPGGSVG